MTLEENLILIQSRIDRAAQEAGRSPGEITLGAATKTQEVETIQRSIAAGVAVCGENRVQELSHNLAEDAYDGAEVHFIGHLQTNKVKHVVGKVALIHSVDSQRLVEAIDHQAEKLDLVQDILLQVNISGEESKGGCTPEELPQLVKFTEECAHVRLRGLMSMPPPVGTFGHNKDFFRKTKELFVDIGGKIGDNESDIIHLSMGMSGDYEEAVAEGATLIRVGTALFGPRAPQGGHI